MVKLSSYRLIKTEGSKLYLSSGVWQQYITHLTKQNEVVVKMWRSWVLLIMIENMFGSSCSLSCKYLLYKLKTLWFPLSVLAAVLEALSAVTGVGNWRIVSVWDSSFCHCFSSSGKVSITEMQSMHQNVWFAIEGELCEQPPTWYSWSPFFIVPCSVCTPSSSLISK